MKITLYTEYALRVLLYLGLHEERLEGHLVVQALGQPAGVDLQIVDRPVRRGDEIRASHRERVDAKFGGHRIEHRLEQRVAEVVMLPPDLPGSARRLPAS